MKAFYGIPGFQILISNGTFKLWKMEPLTLEFHINSIYDAIFDHIIFCNTLFWPLLFRPQAILTTLHSVLKLFWPEGILSPALIAAEILSDAIISGHPKSNSFWGFSCATIHFMKNLSSRKIIRFSHCGTLTQFLVRKEAVKLDITQSILV